MGLNEWAQNMMVFTSYIKATIACGEPVLGNQEANL